MASSSASSLNHIYGIPPLTPEIQPVLPDSKIFYRIPALFDFPASAFPTNGGTNATRGGGATNAVATTAAGGAGDKWSALEQRQNALLAGLAALQEKTRAAGAGAGASAGAGSGKCGSCKTGCAKKREEEVRALKAQCKEQGVKNATTGVAPMSRTVLDVPVQACSTCAVPVVTIATTYLLQTLGASIGVRFFWHSTSEQKLPSTFISAHRGEAAEPLHTRVSVILTKAPKPRAFVNGSHLVGDAVIAKLLCRTHSPDLVGEGDATTATLVDEWLSIAEGDVNEAVARASAQLAKSKFLCGAKLTLADLAIWAAIRGAALTGATKTWCDGLSQQPYTRLAISSF